MGSITRSTKTFRDIPTHPLLSSKNKLSTIVLLLSFSCNIIWAFYSAFTFKSLDDLTAMLAACLGFTILATRGVLLVYYIFLEDLPGADFIFSAILESIILCLGLILSVYAWETESPTEGFIHLGLLILSHFPKVFEISFTIYYISYPSISQYEPVVPSRYIETAARNEDIEMLVVVPSSQESPSYPTLLETIYEGQHENGFEQIQGIEDIADSTTEVPQHSHDTVRQIRRHPNHSFWKDPALSFWSVLAMLVILLLSALELLGAIQEIRQPRISIIWLYGLSIAVSCLTFILTGLPAVLIVKRVKFLRYVYFSWVTLAVLWMIVAFEYWENIYNLVDNCPWTEVCFVMAFVTAMFSALFVISLTMWGIREVAPAGYEALPQDTWDDEV